MADVRGDDRAQLILVGGIVVAFGLVALVLLLNTALFAENLATRGLGPAPDRAGDYAAVGERASDRILRHEEHIEYEKWDNARLNTTRNIFRVEQVVEARQFQEHGAFATVEAIHLRQGTALVQTTPSRNFTAGGLNISRDDWTLAATTRGIRNFTMTVDAANTSNRTEPSNFTVVIRGNAGTGDEWTGAVYENESANAVEVHTNGVTCTSTSPIATINWTAGTLDGCSFPFAVNQTGHELPPPYELAFKNGSSASGTYHVVVSNEDIDEIIIGSFGEANTSQNPRLYHAVYSTCLGLRYEEASIDYETHVRAAPGEPEQTMPEEPLC